MEWRCIGPWRGGRSCAVTGVIGQPNTYYFGATGGGVWKTEDGGNSWQSVSDEYFGGSVGSIAVSTSDPNVIYVGGGEKTVRGNVSFGYGVWKSEDAGHSWKSAGLLASRHISRIRIHPNDHNIVYASVMGDLFKSTNVRGIYKSTDGGDTWAKILYVSEDVGFVDLCMDPNNSRIIYATSWKVRRTPYSLSSGGEGSALWRSLDGGRTWENISDHKGLPDGIWGISGVAISPANSNRLWTIIENKKGGLFRSDDRGETWTRVNAENKLRQRAWYYSRVYADPNNEDIVYVVNVRFHKSKDGGKSFKSYRTPHGDHHDLWIDPNNSNRMIIGDDGGAQVSIDGGNVWTTYHNQPTSQFYRVTTDNDFPYRIYAAQQDNSAIRIQHRTTGYSITERHWESTAGGESAHIAIDPDDNDIVYGGSYGGFLTRKNHRLDQNRAINVWPDNPMGHGAKDLEYRFQWNFPLFFSPHNSDKLYACSNHVHVSYDEGQSWKVISPDLTRNDSTKLESSGGPITKDNTSVEYYCTIFAAAESPVKKDVIWAGSDDGLIHITQDGGSHWQNVTPPDLPEWIMINSLEPDPFNAGGCYVAATMYKWGDFQPYLLKTNDFGQSWKRIDKGIDDEHFTRVIRADPVKQGLLYAGTESGVYVSFDDGGMWQPLQLNLPIVPITDLAIKNNNLVAATQGRSLWILDDLTPLHQVDEMTGRNTMLFKPQHTYRMKGGQNKNVRNAGVNHPGGAMVYYYIDSISKKDTLTLEFMDAQGKSIRQYSTHAEEKSDKLNVESGSNLFIWNLRYPSAKRFDNLIFWWASLAGPIAVPGKYGVRLVFHGDTLTKWFEIIADPRSEASLKDMEAQFDFIKTNADEISKAHEVIKQIRDLKSQLNSFSELHHDHHAFDQLDSMTFRIDSLCSDIENTLYQTKSKSRQDPINYPIKLTNKLAHLNSITGMSDHGPTDQAIELQTQLINEIRHELSRFAFIKENDLPALNDFIRNNDFDAIKLKQEP